LADHVIALGDQVGGAPETQVRERSAELLRERADRVATTQGRVQRVLEPDVRGGELVDDARVKVLAPELREPPAHDGLVLLDRHESFPFLAVSTSCALPAGAPSRRAPGPSREISFPTASAHGRAQQVQRPVRRALTLARTS